MTLSALLFVTAAVAWGLSENHVSFWIHGTWLAAVALITRFITTGLHGSIRPKEALLCIALSWLSVGALCALPFWTHHQHLEYFAFSTALFESFSALTGTGITGIDPQITLPDSLIFWRSLLQWVGGAAILPLLIQLLPILGAGGWQLYRNELPGPSRTRLRGQINRLTRFILLLYLSFSAVILLVFYFGGSTILQAFSGASAIVATGGFFPAELQGHSWVPMVCLPLFGLNMMIWVGLIQKHRPQRTGGREAWVFFVGIAIATIFFFFFGFRWHDHAQLGTAYQWTLSLMTGTDWSMPPLEELTHAGKGLAVILIGTGACAGSTVGGIRIFRVSLIIKTGIRELMQLIQPRAVIAVKFDRNSLEEGLLKSILGYSCLFLVFAVFATFSLIVLEGTHFGSFSLFGAGLACLANAGGAVQTLAGMQDYSIFSESSHYFLIVLMLFGRLEFYALLALFHRDFWRR